MEKGWRWAQKPPPPPQNMGRPAKMLEKSSDNGATIYVLTLLICKYVK
jgi:hypothetical protein